MDPKWTPALVTGLIALLGWAINYGSFQQKLKDVSKQADATDLDLQLHKGKVWERVNTVENKVSTIQGRLSQKGRGANA